MRLIQDNEQTGCILRQRLGAFDRNPSMVNFDFESPITHSQNNTTKWGFVKDA